MRSRWTQSSWICARVLASDDDKSGQIDRCGAIARINFLARYVYSQADAECRRRSRAAVAEPPAAEPGNAAVLRSVRGIVKGADADKYRRHLSEKYR